MPDLPDDVHPLPITGELDLHTFPPGVVRELVTEHLQECRARGILEVRLVHGKGTGQLLRGVHALLPRLPGVKSFALATPAYGGDGATFVHLHPSAPPDLPVTPDGPAPGASGPAASGS